MAVKQVRFARVVSWTLGVFGCRDLNEGRTGAILTRSDTTQSSIQGARSKAIEITPNQKSR